MRVRISSLGDPVGCDDESVTTNGEIHFCFRYAEIPPNVSFDWDLTLKELYQDHTPKESLAILKPFLEFVSNCSINGVKCEREMIIMNIDDSHVPDYIEFDTDEENAVEKINTYFKFMEYGAMAHYVKDIETSADFVRARVHDKLGTHTDVLSLSGGIKRTLEDGTEFMYYSHCEFRYVEIPDNAAFDLDTTVEEMLYEDWNVFDQFVEWYKNGTVNGVSYSKTLNLTEVFESCDVDYYWVEFSISHEDYKTLAIYLDKIGGDSLLVI